MRRLLMVLLMLGVAGTAVASVTGNVNPNVKAPAINYVNPPDMRVPGEDIAQALPATLGTYTGTTAGFINDYDEVCPYTGSLSPDVVYAFTPTPGLLAINVDLCYSSFDTKVYVYDNGYTPGSPVACNDDYYFAAPCFTYSSFVGPVPVVSGHIYYIVIDGYGGSSGLYQMDITDAGTPPPMGACCAASGACSITTQTGCAGTWQGENTVCDPNPCPGPQPVVCPPDGLVEVEDNGGCNSVPQVFQPLNPVAGGCAVQCGTAWANSSSRDTDWFVSIGTGALMTGVATGEFPMQYLLIYGTDCGAPAYLFGTGDPGVPVTLSWTVADGDEVWNWIGSSQFANWPESDYTLELCGIQDPPPPPGACCNSTGACVVVTPDVCAFLGGIFYGGPCLPTTCVPVPTESKSWGAVKNLYR